MVLWLWLFVMGWITYVLLKRSKVLSGKVPLWLLWVVMMTPALVWATWALVHGPDEPMPVLLAFGPFILSPLLYWILLRQQGALKPTPQLDKPTETPTTQLKLQEPPKLLEREEEATLNHCFPWSHFALHKVEQKVQVVICQGQLRADPADAYQKVQTNVKSRFGDRFMLLLQEGWNGKPFFALVPNPRLKKQNTDSEKPLYRPLVAGALLLLTLLTTTLVGSEFAGVDLESLEQLRQTPRILLQGLPYAVALMCILGLHELGHFFTARYYKMQSTLPYFIPVPTFLGTFGAFIQMRSPFPNRRALFDVSIAGPIAGLVIALPCLWWGLAHSTPGVLEETSSLFNFQSLDPWQSALMAIVGRLALGERFTAEIAISMHPIAIAGYLGIIVTALNLTPVGQLDGGHMIHASFGQRTGAIVGQVARLLMLLLAIRQAELLLWALLLLFVPVIDEPALNDVSELNDLRDFLTLLMLGLLVLIVIPFPSFLVNWLV
ncbi:MAG: site-2 protease family protein [Cyanobacteria bacterium P01_H01_bin.121]